MKHPANLRLREVKEPASNPTGRWRRMCTSPCLTSPDNLTFSVSRLVHSTDRPSGPLLGSSVASAVGRSGEGQGSACPIITQLVCRGCVTDSGRGCQCLKKSRGKTQLLPRRDGISSTVHLPRDKHAQQTGGRDGSPSHTPPCTLSHTGRLPKCLW